MSIPAAIVWFRNDLRLADNPTFAAACERGSVVPVFIVQTDENKHWSRGGASCWWLSQSLRSLDTDLRSRGGRLFVLKGGAGRKLIEAASASGADTVCWTERWEPELSAFDRMVQDELESVGLRVEVFNSHLLADPARLVNLSGSAYRVFTPFYNACLEIISPAPPKPAPEVVRLPDSLPESFSVDEIASFSGFIPSNHTDCWTPGEKGALEKISKFIDSAARYADARDRPDLDLTSRLSPHLHFGEISVSQVWHEVSMLRSRDESAAEGCSAFLRQLCWREFGYYLLHHFPETTERPLRPEFEKFPWADDSESFNLWCNGLTGYPLVDAGMRELKHTGWMHNRVRLAAASFLVKDLLIPWQQGARWFWDMLVDADLANNTLGWQWTAGCGADAAPYFRIFNPVLQGMKFDPDGDYVRRWVPELARMPAEWIHRPFDAPLSVLMDSGLDLGKTYPMPVVDHSFARERALAAFSRIRQR